VSPAGETMGLLRPGVCAAHAGAGVRPSGYLRFPSYWAQAAPRRRFSSLRVAFAGTPPFGDSQPPHVACAGSDGMQISQVRPGTVHQPPHSCVPC
jgi:hypothetical protein